MPSAKVYVQGCTLFVPLVESGYIDKHDVIVYETVKRYLQPLKEADVDTLILGCTHYPVLAPTIKRYMGDNVTLINAGISTAYAVKDALCKNNLLNTSEKASTQKYFVSDITPSFKSTANLLLGKETTEEQLCQVDIEKI